MLIIEDDSRFRETLSVEFKDRGYTVRAVSSLAELAQELDEPVAFRFAVVDLRIKTDRGLDAVPLILKHSPKCRIVILTGYGSIATAVEAVKLGAANYLTKPVDIARLERALWTDEPEKANDIEEREGETLARHEREYIEYVLEQCQGNVTKAAQWLGLHRQSLQRKLRKFTPK
jgi:two-component system response regulator RegA